MINKTLSNKGWGKDKDAASSKGKGKEKEDNNIWGKSNNKDNKNIFDRAWWVSIFIFAISQLVDIQYFDGRISIFYCILLSGVKNIINENISIKTKIWEKNFFKLIFLNYLSSLVSHFL